MAHPQRFTETFKARLRGKSPQDQGTVLNAVARLVDNPRHPSLRTGRMAGTRGLFEARASRSLRITWEWDGPTIVLRNNCKHDETLGSP